MRPHHQAASATTRSAPYTRLALVALAMLASASLAACRASTPAVPVMGARADLAALVGEWVGEYSSPESGRSGSIVFVLVAGADTAHGDVVMTPRGSGEQPSPNEPAAAAGARPLPQPISIRFVRLANGRVSGTLEPYRDPELGGVVSTVFTGTIDGDRIGGTFTTTGGNLPRAQQGEWHATRRTPR